MVSRRDEKRNLFLSAGCRRAGGNEKNAFGKIAMRFFFLTLLCCACGSLLAQENKSLQELRTAYESFEYRTVVKIADKLLLRKERLTEESLLALYVMKAVAHFSLSEEDLARRSFFEILFLHNGYELDSTTISPKIIDFYMVVKSEFEQIMARRSEIKTEKKDSIIPIPKVMAEQKEIRNDVMLRSFLLPGLGHISSDDDLKGYIISSLSVLTLGTMVYSIIDVQTKEKEYLAETIPSQIEAKYSQYNSSYKMRNITITAYTFLWLYAQIDLAYFPGNSRPLVSVSFEKESIYSQSSRIKLAFPVFR
jgi:hypothetical protein